MSQSFGHPSRRKVLGFLAGGSALGATLATQTTASNPAHGADSNTNNKAATTPATRKPPRLNVGDTVGMVAPATGFYEPEEIEIAKESIEQYGFKVILSDNIMAQHSYLAGTDQQRANDINAMFARDDVKGIMTFAGGYGCSRILPYLDYDLIRRNPKVILGHSDITALLLGIYQKTGVVTFHGSSGLTGVGEYAMEHFRRTVMQSQKAGRIAQPPANTSKEVERTNRVISIVKGKASGALVGGNLTLVTNLMGTPYEIDTKGKILFLEEVGEEPYRVDRMLTQLWLGGKFQDAAGIALGRFANCESKEYKPSFWTTFSVEQVIRDRFMPLGKPTLYNLMFGHVKENAVLPLGVMATLDATTKTLTLDESAVI